MDGHRKDRAPEIAPVWPLFQSPRSIPSRWTSSSALRDFGRNASFTPVKIADDPTAFEGTRLHGFPEPFQVVSPAQVIIEQVRSAGPLPPPRMYRWTVPGSLIISSAGPRKIVQSFANQNDGSRSTRLPTILVVLVSSDGCRAPTCSLISGASRQESPATSAWWSMPSRTAPAVYTTAVSGGASGHLSTHAGSGRGCRWSATSRWSRRHQCWSPIVIQQEAG